MGRGGAAPGWGAWLSGCGRPSWPTNGWPRDGPPPGARHFDLCGPLPGPGVTVLEASAGTGKTFTIAALVARMVAEGLAPLSEILVVTFTRMATGRLRERVRARLVSAEAGWRRLLATGETGADDDALLALWSGAEPDLVGERRERLAACWRASTAPPSPPRTGFAIWCSAP